MLVLRYEKDLSGCRGKVEDGVCKKCGCSTPGVHCFLATLSSRSSRTTCAGCRCRTCRELANARCPAASSVVVGKSEHRIFHFPYFISLASLTLYIPFCILKHISAQICFRCFIIAHSRTHTTHDLSLERAHQEKHSHRLLTFTQNLCKKTLDSSRSDCRASRQLRRTHSAASHDLP